MTPVRSLPREIPASRDERGPGPERMSQTPTADPVARTRALLEGYPAGTIDAAVRYAEAPSAAALDRLVLGVLVFHLPARPDGPLDPDTLSRSARIVADLAVDSLTLIELSFLMEDLIGVKLQDEDLRAILTVDDLLQVVHRRVGLAPL